MNESEVSSSGIRAPRGPAYPSISLIRAIDYIRQIYDKDKQIPTSPEVAVKHLGFKSLSGPATRALAALKAFQLLEEEGKNLRVSDTAMHIMYPHSDSEKAEALLQAINGPKIYEDMISHYGGGDIRALILPSNSTLANYLIREKNFNHKVVPNFLRNFRESLDLVKSHCVEGEQMVSEEVAIGGFVERPDERRDEIAEGEIVDIPIRLPGGRKARLVIPTPFYETDKRHLIKQIEIIVTDEETKGKEDE